MASIPDKVDCFVAINLDNLVALETDEQLAMSGRGQIVRDEKLYQVDTMSGQGC